MIKKLSCFAGDIKVKPHEFIKNAAATFQLLLLAAIAFLLVLDCEREVLLLAKLNMAYVGLLFFVRSLQSQQKIFTTPSIILLSLALIGADLLTVAHYERLYINVAIVLAYILLKIIRPETRKDAYQLGSIIGFVSIFTLLHLIAVECLCFSDYIWHAWYATFITLNIWLLAKHNIHILKNLAPKITLTLLFVYTFLVAQMPIKTIPAAFKIFDFKIDYNSTFSTFNIAIYASLALVIAVYYFFRASKVLELALVIIIIILSHHILATSWLPVWLGLAVGLVLSLLLMKNKKPVFIALAILILQADLYTIKTAPHGEQLNELTRHVIKEERTAIWSDAWEMQKASPVKNWIYGHGQNEFLIDFQSYSRYHKQNTNFTSPHNSVLDVLYASGLLGLTLLLCACFYTYFFLIKLVCSDEKNKALGNAILIALTTMLISNGLNYGFLRLISIFPLAFIYGSIIYIYQNKIQIQNIQHTP